MLFGRMYWVSSHMKALIVTKRILIQNSFCSFQSFSRPLQGSLVNSAFKKILVMFLRVLYM